MNCIHPPSLTLPRCRYMGSAWLSRAASWCYRPVATDQPVEKQKIRLLCNFFAIRDSFSVPGTYKQVAVRLVICGFYVLNRDRGTRTIPNRKKVANPTVILFLGSRGCRAQAPWRGGGALTFRLTRFAGESCSNHLFDLNGVQSHRLIHCAWT